ncbi:MAG: hypothetical protein N2C14_07985, partial [Planctomycetales bacterium]
MIQLSAQTQTEQTEKKPSEAGRHIAAGAALRKKPKDSPSSNPFREDSGTTESASGKKASP